MEHVPDAYGENERWDRAPRLGAAIPDSLGSVAPDSLKCYRCEFPYAGKMVVEMAARGKLERVFSLGPLALGIVARTEAGDLPWMKRHKLWHTHRLPHLLDAAKPATQTPTPVLPWEPEASPLSGAPHVTEESATGGPRKKSTHSTRTLSLPVKNEKAPTDIFHAVGSPSSLPVSGVGFSGSVVGGDVRSLLVSLLVSHGFVVWSSRSRVSGLMALASFFASSVRNLEGGNKHGVRCSNRLALQYCSKLRSAPKGVPLQPLAVLIRIGVVERVMPARVNFASKSSARYRIAKRHQGAGWVSSDDKTNDCIKRKLAGAKNRLESGLNRRWPFRAQLLRDLAQVSIPDSAHPVRDELLGQVNMRPSTLGVIKAISTGEHGFTVIKSGQIVTSLLSCPKQLKPLLLLAGEPVSLCDISSAHFMFLPRLIADRMEHCRKRGDDESSLEPLKVEMLRLIEVCSSGSFYKQMCRDGASDAEIQRMKKLANILVNSPQSKADKNCIWRGLKHRFPHCIRIINAIKKKDHRKISSHFQHFTANAVNSALLDLQTQGIPAIPDTDCLIVRDMDKTAACLAIGKAMFDETRGVYVTVGGIRYSLP